MRVPEILLGSGGGDQVGIGAVQGGFTIGRDLGGVGAGDDESSL
jgi:hypothetical protein